MKKIKVILLSILFLLIAITIIDVISINSGNNPIFAKENSEENSSNKIFRGIFFDTYNCTVYSAPQIKAKWSKFSCPEANVITSGDNVKKEVSLTLVGDLLFEQPFYDAVNKGYDKQTYFSLVKEYFEKDDLSLGNMEVVIGNDNMDISGVGYNFCAPEYIGKLVNSIDFEVLGTANNHAYDRGITGINSTIDFFEANTDIRTIGTYKSVKERDKGLILDINDVKIGFLNYTYGTNQKVSTEYKDLIAYYKDPYSKEITDEYKEILKEEINKIKQKSDVVIVLMHWGIEFTYKPNYEQKEMANYLNSLGVDIIVGSHSHCIQPIEVIGDEHKTLVYYSLGNFVSADDDIARTPLGEEEFDNAYQVGMLSNLKIIKDNDKIEIKDVNTELMVNYFDKNMDNFKIVPLKKYDELYEKTHYRYEKGLNKEFINNMYESVIDKKYRN